MPCENDRRRLEKSFCPKTLSSFNSRPLVLKAYSSWLLWLLFFTSTLSFSFENYWTLDCFPLPNSRSSSIHTSFRYVGETFSSSTLNSICLLCFLQLPRFVFFFFFFFFFFILSFFFHFHTLSSSRTINTLKKLT